MDIRSQAARLDQSRNDPTETSTETIRCIIIALSSEGIVRSGKQVSGTRVERRLAAVLAVDVAGYSRLMGADEVGTLEALKAHRREAVDSTIASHRGRIVKTTGDGMLVEKRILSDACQLVFTSTGSG